MTVGRLRHRVEIQQGTESRTASGSVQVAEPWATLAIRWAAVEPLSSREKLTAQQQDVEITHRITLREYPGLNSGHRFRWGTRLFYLTGPPLRREEIDGRYQECLCTEPD